MKRVSLSDIIEYIMAFSIIYSHSIYNYTNATMVNNIIKGVLSITPLTLLLIRPRIKKSVAVNYTKLLTLYLLMLGIYTLIKIPQSGRTSFVLRFFIFLPSLTLYFCSCKDRYSLFHKITIVVAILTVISLPFWVLGSNLHLIHPTGQLYTTWGYKYVSNYLGVCFEIPHTTAGLPLLRNVSIFAEAPAYSFFLSVAYMYACIVDTKSSKNIQTILLIGLISTLTNTSLVAILLVIISKYSKQLKRITKNKIFRRVLVLGAIILGAFMVYKYMHAPGKMQSVRLRILDYSNGFQAFLISPIMGNGYKNEGFSIYNAGYSNSLSAILMDGGLTFIIVYLLPMIWIVINKRRDKTIVFYIGMLVMFSICIVSYTYTILAYLAYIYSLFLSRKVKVKSKTELVRYKNMVQVS